MDWYVASLLTVPKAISGEHVSQGCQYLIEAESHNEAYDHALELGNRVAKGDCNFLGVEELLLMIDQELVDGAELLWSEFEIKASELQTRIQGKGETRAFREGPPSSGWYICSVVLCEVHDEGSHGDRSLTWENTYLIQAHDAEAGYQRAVQIGTDHQDRPGSHQCDGDNAHWEFKGIRDLIPVREVPDTDSLLWCDEISADDGKLRRMIPAKSELSVFRWEAERRHQRT